MKTDFDIIIVGGGMVGAALAVALAQSQYRYALLERQPRQHFLDVSNNKPDHKYESVADYDSRVSALTAASQGLLDKLGAWSAMKDLGVSPYQEMWVWDAEGTASIDFSAAEFHLPELGHIVENRVTLAALYQRLEQMEKSNERFSLLDGTSIEKLELVEQGGQVKLASGEIVNASLVVAADGANSLVRHAAGLATREWDYQHDAIVATVEMAIPHESIARQRFIESGPLAFLPLSSPQHCSIVWSAKPDFADQLMAMNDAGFGQVLSEHLEGALGATVAVSTRHRFPLRQRHAKQYFDESVVLVGDAAHTIHPLAGQGVNLGFMDVVALGDELVRASKRGLPANDKATLQRYQRRRMGANLAMAGLMEGFKRLFEQDALPARWLRNTGMRWLNNQPFLKKQIIREAMGLRIT